METPVVYSAGPVGLRAPFSAPPPAGPLVIEYAPDCFVNLDSVVEAQVIDGDLCLLLPPPTDVGRGAHVVMLTGEPHDLALAYFRARAAATRAALLPFLTP